MLIRLIDNATRAMPRRWPSRWHRAIRQAGAILICLVPIFVIAPCSPAYARFMIPKKSDFGCSRPTECISILNFSQKIEVFHSVSDCGPFEWCQSLFSSTYKYVFATWINDIFWPDDSVRGSFKDEFFRQWFVARFQYTPATNLICWRLTAIFHYVLNQQWISVYVDRVSKRPHIGTQLRSGGFFSTSYQIPSGDPQKYCRESENNRECGNDCFGIVVGEAPKTITVDTEQNRDRGNTFLKILGCAMGIFLLNTCLKWVGTFNNHYDGR
jgi:hypothetical protein